MIYRMHTPAFPLSQYIEFFFYYEGYAAEHSIEKLLPDGSVDLLIDLTEPPKKLFHDEGGSRFTTLKRSWISGMKTDYILIDASVSHMIGAHFKPGGCYPFVDFPMFELNNRTIQLDEIWGNGIHSIREAILETCIIETRFELLEQFLFQKGKSRM